jgi:hypothetical protein
LSLSNDNINALYRLPLAEFTTARNALAKTLSGDDAKRVKGLAKPTVVPWAVNQLYWQARPLFEQLMKHGDALRTAQIDALKGRSADLPRAAEQHRKALAEAVRQATEIAEAHGAHPGADDLGRMLEALSLAPARAEHPGRFTELVQPAGFEALAGITPVRVNPPQPAAAARSGSPAAASVPKGAAGSLEGGPQRPRAQKHNVSAFRRTADEAARERAERAAAEREEKEAERRRQEAQAALKAAERTLERAKAEEAKLRDAFDRAQEERRAAEIAFSAARKAARDA